MTHKMEKSFIDSLVLNEIQKRAVTYCDGPQVVFAGAGTGKTRVLTAKIAYLIKQCSIPIHAIFAATFTNKAAKEMRQRVESLIGTSCQNLWIGTFHSLCCRILRHHAKTIGYLPSFTIYDEDDQLSCLKKCMKELQIDERTLSPKTLQNRISWLKNECLKPQEAVARAQTYLEKEVAKLYEVYQSSLKKFSAMDFDDLLSNTVYLLHGHQPILDYYRNYFQYILVDEFQDTNKAQCELIKLFASSHKRVFVVGDDDQSIYSWRGAQITHILNFSKIFEDALTVTLEQNYRSTQAVLNFGNAIISTVEQRSPKKLWTAGRAQSEVIVVRYRDDRHEAESIAIKIKNLIAKQYKPSLITVLFRTNAQSRCLEDALRKHSIAYVLVGGLSFYERREIKDCCAYLRLLVNPKDTMALERILNVPARGIGIKTYEKLIEMSKAQGMTTFELIMSGRAVDISEKAGKGVKELREVFMACQKLLDSSASVKEIMEEILVSTGYLDYLEEEDERESTSRIENVNELINAITQWQQANVGKGLADYLEEITLTASIDRWDQADSCVNLMTLHASKGLEFSAVFLAGCEDGILPSRQNMDDPEKLDEECRLMYVGVTRAMQHLECSYATMRMRFGSTMVMEPSQFFSSVDEALYRFKDETSLASFTPYHTIEPRAGIVSARKSLDSTLPTKTVIKPSFDDHSQETVQYRKGQGVMHGKYGKGVISAISGFGPDLQLTIQFEDGSKKRMIAKFANLQMIDKN